METSGFSQKKWKYLSFALMAVIASGLLAPTAFAASPTLTDIFNKLGIIDTKVGVIDTKVTGIKTNTDSLPSDPASNTQVNTRASQTSLNTLQSDVTAIKTNTNNLPSDPASQAATGSVKTLKFHHTFDPSADDRGGGESFGLLAPSSGKTVAGHISMFADRDAFGNQISLLCFTGPDGIVRIIDGVSNIRGFSVDFACTQLILEVHDPDPESGPVDIEGLAQYVESSDITNIS